MFWRNCLKETFILITLSQIQFFKLVLCLFPFLFLVLCSSLLLRLARFGAAVLAMRLVTINLNQLYAHLLPPLLLPMPQSSWEIAVLLYKQITHL